MKVMVLGAGVAGIATAYYLRQSGFDVTVLEPQLAAGRETCCVGCGMSGGVAPWVARSTVLQTMRGLLLRHGPPALRPGTGWQQYQWVWRLLRNCSAAGRAASRERLLRLTGYGQGCFAELCEAAGLDGAGGRCGIIRVFYDRQQLEMAVADMQRAVSNDLSCSLLLPDEIGRVEPALHGVRHRLAGALYWPGARSVDCCGFAGGLSTLARAAGVEFRFGSNIEQLPGEGDRVQGVRVNGALLRADHYVLALDERARALLDGLGIAVPMHRFRSHALAYDITDAAAAPHSTVFDSARGVTITRFGRRLRLHGMQELAGRRPDPQRRHALAMVADTLFPLAGDSRSGEFQAGLCHVTPDGVPVVGATAYANLTLNIAHGGSGCAVACGTSRYLADRLAGRTPEISGEGLDIFRYATC